MLAAVMIALMLVVLGPLVLITASGNPLGKVF